MTPEQPVEPTWHRLSPRMLLIHPITELVRALPAVAGIVLAGSGNGHGLISGVVVVGLVTALALARWFTTQLRITSEQVELRHGLLRRRSVATRRDRIRTVDVTAHLLHRLLGLSRVVIGTGTSDRKRDDLVLDGLTADAAARLRGDLLHHTPAATPSQSVAAADLVELARLDRRWVWFAPFTLSGVITGLVVWGFFWRLQGDGVDLVHSGPFRAIGHRAEEQSVVTVVVAVIVLVVLFVTVTSLVGYVLAFWNFRLTRHAGGSLEVTRGLLTTRSTSIERRRLVGVQVSDSPLLRAVGGARLLAVATGLRIGRGAERGGEALLPPAPARVVLATGRAVLDGTPALTASLRRHGAGARRRRHTRALLGALVFLAAALIGWATGGTVWPVGLGVLLVVLAPLLAQDRYRNLGHAVSDGYLVVQTGSIARRKSVLAGDAVIGWNMRRTFFQRRLGLATLTATTAAGRQGDRLLDIATDEALTVAELVTPALIAQFRSNPTGIPQGMVGETTAERSGA